MPQTPPEPSFGAPLLMTESPVETRPELAVGTDTLQSVNTKGQLLWEKHMKDIDLQRRYRKVSALMIHWEREGEDPFDAQDEINRLSETFRTHFHFTVSEKKLNTLKGRSVQVQINKHLADFVYEEDAEDTLLIIYYAGHGTPDSVTGRLLLAGGNLPPSEEIPDHLNYVIWQNTEHLIHSAHRADIFLIMDCCHAGKLLNMRQKIFSDRIFEFLGAAGPDELTCLPGPESFTSALIWALEELAKEKEPFMTSELLAKIIVAPKFPRTNQLPCLTELGIHCPRRLILEPVTTEVVPRAPKKSEETTSSMEYCLNLQFLLPALPTDKEIHKMCEGVKGLIKTHHLTARQILWKGLYSKDSLRTEMPRIVREWLLTAKVKTLERRLRTLSDAGINGDGYSARKQYEPEGHDLLTPVSDRTLGKRSREDTALEDEDEAMSEVSPSKRQRNETRKVDV